MKKVLLMLMLLVLLVGCSANKSEDVIRHEEVNNETESIKEVVYKKKVPKKLKQ